ncbi:unnamed protein product [Ambrosiozyma monospora]|uniref:Unnamed protein product n=1 Tax=Ambrosiozyma monospora TaxID=43982 RepID=A0A9W6TA07_AMBMO|nr:unnamed protein product [Ambrosiozyma monospora]
MGVGNRRNHQMGVGNQRNRQMEQDLIGVGHRNLEHQKVMNLMEQDLIGVGHRNREYQKVMNLMERVHQMNQRNLVLGLMVLVRKELDQMASHQMEHQLE